MSVPIRPFVDRILDGHLDRFLSEARAEGLSYERVARKLNDEHGIDVTSEQVRKWCLQVDALSGEAAS